MALVEPGNNGSNSFEEFGSNLLPKKPPKKKTLLLAPKPKKHYKNSAASSSAAAPAASTSAVPSGASASGGSSSGGGGAAAAAARAARAAARAQTRAQNKAANRFEQQAATLEGQAAALNHALKFDFQHSLDVRLGNVSKILATQQALLNEGYLKRFGSLKGTIDDNAKAEGQQTGINTQNFARERSSAVNEAMTHGAGESDVMQAQLMALRNWQANQAEVGRSYFDTLRSTNSSLADLNVDTKTAKTTNEIQSNADKEQLWTNYYNQRSETLTNLGNVRGQQADYLSQAHEMSKNAGKGYKDKQKQAKDAFALSAKESGKAWTNPGVSKGVQDWQGEGQFKPDINGFSKLEAARTVSLSKRPEGATLRKW